MSPTELSPPPARPGTPAQPPVAARPVHPEAGEAFAHLLLLKLRQADEPMPAEPGQPVGLGDVPAWWPAPRHDTPAPVAVPVQATGAVPAPSATAQALLQQATPPAEANAPAGQWDVCLPGGLSVRATAPVVAAQPWVLGVAAPPLGAPALARHAHRLEQRLRAHGLTGAQVKVREHEDDGEHG